MGEMIENRTMREREERKTGEARRESGAREAQEKQIRIRRERPGENHYQQQANKRRGSWFPIQTVIITVPQ